jgi:sirohydrochlorin cobaltochelatase
MLDRMREIEMNREKKKAILAVSFGTSYSDTRRKTIDKIEQDIRMEYPDIPLYRGWTSGHILKKVRERDGVRFDSVPEAMERMEKEGVQVVVVQPTHVMKGIENERMTEDILKYEDRFDKIVFGNPLLSGHEDRKNTAKAVLTEFDGVHPEEALVLMGHGTSHQANEVYAALGEIFRQRRYNNVFVGTVEGSPLFSDILKLVKKGNYKKVHLAPLMLVAGDHAVNDMSGEDESSWKNQLEAEGFEVECHLKGLGEYPDIRRIFIEHLRDALSVAG